MYLHTHIGIDVCKKETTFSRIPIDIGDTVHASCVKRDNHLKSVKINNLIGCEGGIKYQNIPNESYFGLTFIPRR